jgi:hypothetical protein
MFVLSTPFVRSQWVSSSIDYLLYTMFISGIILQAYTIVALTNLVRFFTKLITLNVLAVFVRMVIS